MDFRQSIYIVPLRSELNPPLNIQYCYSSDPFYVFNVLPYTVLDGKLMKCPLHWQLFPTRSGDKLRQLIALPLISYFPELVVANTCLPRVIPISLFLPSTSVLGVLAESCFKHLMHSLQETKEKKIVLLWISKSR